jgi:hypothetical protein
MLKVLFHVNEMERWSVTLGNIKNLFIDVGEQGADVVVLANGGSVAAYGEPEIIALIQELSDKGATFIACRNSLKKLCSSSDVCVNENALPHFIKVVPAGITELIKRQAAGYAYVKP